MDLRLLIVLLPILLAGGWAVFNIGKYEPIVSLHRLGTWQHKNHLNTLLGELSGKSLARYSKATCCFWWEVPAKGENLHCMYKTALLVCIEKMWWKGGKCTKRRSVTLSVA